MKRILIAVSDDLNTDQRVLRIAGSLKAMGFDVFLLGRVTPASRPLNIDFGARRFKLLATKGMAFYALLNWRLFGYLLFHKFDVALANDLDTLAGVSLAARLKRRPVVYDSHEYFTELPELVGRPMKRKIWLKAEQIFVPHTVAAYTVCDSLAAIYSEKYGKPFDVVRNLPYRQADTPMTGRRNVVLYQGALNVGRGIELMIDAMRYLPDYELWIAGAGDVEADLRQRAEASGYGQRIKFLGRLSPADLHQKTRQAKVGLSIEEDMGLNYHYALPNKLFDYIQARVPVVVADLPEMRKVVEDYQVGEVLTERTAESLAQKIAAVAANAATYEPHLQQAAEQLCWENESIRLKEIYSPLL